MSVPRSVATTVTTAAMMSELRRAVISSGNFRISR